MQHAATLARPAPALPRLVRRIRVGRHLPAIDRDQCCTSFSALRMAHRHL